MAPLNFEKNFYRMRLSICSSVGFPFLFVVNTRAFCGAYPVISRYIVFLSVYISLYIYFDYLFSFFFI
ncbi:hypothetical protein PUN28_019746 [Cardiocondyla obscurior]|uniref:Uncharacterized protein n=1 Tax=Cardiocondyla obscurior TaxID=286306 RepID=A0AAW2E758_9HYME